MNTRFLQAIQRQRNKSEEASSVIAGSLGIAIGGALTVEVPSRPSFVYVQLRNSQAEVIQAFNDQVAPAFGLPVLVQWQGTRYVITGRDTLRYGNWQTFSPYLPRHANTHEFNGPAGGGGDLVFVFQQQMMPVLPMPSGTLGATSIIINDYIFMNTSGQFSYSPVQATSNLTVWKPTMSTGAQMVLVSLDMQTDTLRYDVGSGSVFSAALTGSADVVSHIPTVPNISRYLPLAAIRLVTGTFIIGWDNIYDVRQIFGVGLAGPPGAGGGGGSTGSGGTTGAFLRLDTSNGPLTGPLVVYQTAPDNINQYGDFSTVVGYLSGTSNGEFAGAVEAVVWSTGTQHYGIYIDDEGAGGGGLFIFHLARMDTPTSEINHNIDDVFGKPKYYNSPTYRITRQGGNDQRSNYKAPAFIINENVATAGPSIELDVQFGAYLSMWPAFTGTPFSSQFPFPTASAAAPYTFDVAHNLPTGTILANYNHNNLVESWLTPDGIWYQDGLGMMEHTGGFNYTKGSTLGLAKLNNGQVFVSAKRTSSSTRIFLTINFPGTGTLGFPYVASRAAGTGFTIQSSSSSDTSQVAWLLVEPFINQ